MPWFLNHYLCEECKKGWDDEWSSTCEDDCPHCGARHMEPYDSTDLTEVIEEQNGEFAVYISSESAEDSPDYELVATFPTRDQAAAFLKDVDK